MLPSYFDYIFVHLRQKARLRPELSPKSLSTLGPNPTRKARPDLQIWSNSLNVNNHFAFDCLGLAIIFAMPTNKLQQSEYYAMSLRRHRARF